MTDKLTLLGKKTTYQYHAPDASLLECFANPLLPEWGGTVHIEAPEFTSLCPKTGQPDFATILIDYRPNMWCVESKSLKLYLGSFRMHGAFHEECVQRISTDLVRLLKPTALRVEGRFTPRGGIKFWPVVSFNS